jgi:hypothetical protein
MLQIDVSSDIDAAIAEVGEFWRSQVPFATAKAINDTIFEVRNYVVETTYPQAFKVRNKRFPGLLFKIGQKAYKKAPEAILGQTLDRDYMERHTRGGIKTGRGGGRIAIPTDPESMRTATGRIQASKKPLRLEQQKNVFTITKGDKKYVVRKNRGKGKPNTLLYIITPSAKIDGFFRFYEDATRVTIDTFPVRWSAAMTQAINTSRFNATP